jgi:hypothetical protein
MIKEIPENEFSLKPAPGKWSKKEILGHLIDSATNNHQRFVRAPFDNMPRIVYDQDNWNKHSYHQLAGQKDIIDFWEMYNRYLLFIIKHIPQEDQDKQCLTNDPVPNTLGWLIEDYVVHMEHHLKQIIDYK